MYKAFLVLCNNMIFCFWDKLFLFNLYTKCPNVKLMMIPYRFCEASHLAGTFISEPDSQPVVRLPLYVPQVGMNHRWVCRFRRTEAERVALCRVDGPQSHSVNARTYHLLDWYLSLSLSTDVSWQIFSSVPFDAVWVCDSKYYLIHHCSCEFVAVLLTCTYVWV